VSNNHEQKLIDHLKKLPDIKDNTDKNELYQRISLQIADEAPAKQKQKKRLFIPLLATAAVLMFFISLPYLLNSGNQQTTIHDTESSKDQEISMMDEEEPSGGMESNLIEGLEENEDSSEISDEVQGFDTTSNSIFQSRVIEDVDSESQIAYLAAYDDQLQYLIPISLIIPEDANLMEYYNEMSSILSSENLLPENFILEEVNFKLDYPNNEVVLSLSEDFSLGDGSARPAMFQQLLEEMFLPYGMERAVFESGKSERIDLGPIGEVTELAFTENRHSSYMIYKEKYFVPVPQGGDIAIDEAMQTLKTSVPEFQLEKTIPEEINFTVKDNEDELILSFNGDAQVESNQTTVTMIESILLTAKSYGYQHVSFQNMPIDEIGMYNLTEPINVPIGANPIYYNSTSTE